jgi:hypothetical protein
MTSPLDGIQPGQSAKKLYAIIAVDPKLGEGIPAFDLGLGGPSPVIVTSRSLGEKIFEQLRPSLGQAPASDSSCVSSRRRPSFCLKIDGR